MMSRAVLGVGQMRTKKTWVHVIFGLSETGKSRMAHRLAGTDYTNIHFQSTESAWYDGYHTQEIMIMDGMNGQTKIQEIISMMGDSSCFLPVRYGRQAFIARILIMVSSRTLNEWYTEAQGHVSRNQQKNELVCR